MDFYKAFLDGSSYYGIAERAFKQLRDDGKYIYSHFCGFSEIIGKNSRYFPKSQSFFYSLDAYNNISYLCNLEQY